MSPPPLRIASVAWISSRGELLATFWVLATAIAYLAAHRQGGRCRRYASLGCAGLALLSNALGRCVPGLLWLFDLTVALTVVSALHYVYLASVRGKAAA